jgi:hypothetical protein
MPETEQQTKTAKYVLLAAGERNDYFVAIPLDVFIEMDGEIPVLKMEGDKLKLITTPTAFTLIGEEYMEAIRTEAK